MHLTSSAQARMMMIAIAACFYSGCAFTTMETARQLDADQTSYSGSLNLIGFGPVPRAGFNVITGIEGAGDMSLHAGTTLFTANAGVGGRLYLTDRFNLSLQLDAMSTLMDLGVLETGGFLERMIFTATPRLTTAIKGTEFLYGGLQANVLTQVWDDEPTFMGVAGGLVVGIDFSGPTHGGLQVELIVVVATLQDGSVRAFSDLDRGEVLVGQLSVGFNGPGL